MTRKKFLLCKNKKRSEMCVFEMWDLLLWHIIMENTSPFSLFSIQTFKTHNSTLKKHTQKMSKSKFHIWFCRQKLCVLSQIIDFKWIMNDQRRLFSIFSIVWKTLKSSRLNKNEDIFVYLMLAVLIHTTFINISGSE